MHLRIYKTALATMLSMVVGFGAFASSKQSHATVSNAELTRNGSLVLAAMDIAFDSLKVKSSGATVIQPMIVNGSDTLRLPTVGVYGRTSWYTGERNNRLQLGGVPGTELRYKKKMEPMQYRQTVEFEPWMTGSRLVVEQSAYGCAACDKGSVNSGELAMFRGTGDVMTVPVVAEKAPYAPALIYQAVVAEEVKTRELSGRAYVDFPVNKTEIYPTYRRNEIELAKIIATIDSVRNDKDITVTAITIKGFASPEGPYNNNVRLAKGRTAALKAYVRGLYNFPENFIQTSYEPEDWEGLREYVVKSNIENRQGILDIIDSNLAPDPKNTKIQTTYPVQYKFLLDNVYPGLRHSDYTIRYDIRSFSDPVEIRELLRTAPGKLSLSEIYIAVRDLEPGSKEYNEIIETGARLFPTDGAANLNAANASMLRGDVELADYYLQRAGDSAESDYARGMLAAMKGDYAAAVTLVEKAQARGLEIDSAVLENLRQLAQ